MGVLTGFQAVRVERVASGLAGNLISNPSLPLGAADGFLKRGSGTMPPEGELIDWVVAQCR